MFFQPLFEPLTLGLVLKVQGLESLGFRVRGSRFRSLGLGGDLRKNRWLCFSKGKPLNPINGGVPK